MGRATVVVEAGLRSGSINTANHCDQLGRPVGAVPGPVTSPTSAGCHLLLREHRAELVATADDVVRLAAGDAAVPVEPLADPDDPRSQRITKALTAGTARPLADVAARAGMSETDAAGLLGVLLLDGAVRKSDAGWVLLRRSG